MSKYKLGFLGLVTFPKTLNTLFYFITLTIITKFKKNYVLFKIRGLQNSDVTIILK